MRRLLAFALVVPLPLLAVSAGCSKEQVRGSAFESMRHISNQENARNPNYDADRVGDYGQYEAQREEYLKGEEKTAE